MNKQRTLLLLLLLLLLLFVTFMQNIIKLYGKGTVCETVLF